MATTEPPTKRKEEQKFAVLQHFAEEQALEVYETFDLERELTYADVVENRVNVINNDVTDEETTEAGSDFEILEMGMRSTRDQTEWLLPAKSTPLEDGRCTSELLTGLRIWSRLSEFSPKTPKPFRRRSPNSNKRYILRPLKEGRAGVSTGPNAPASDEEDFARTDDFEDTCPAWEPDSIQVVLAAMTPPVYQDGPAMSSSGSLTSTLVSATTAVPYDGP
ncbi:hypothetical protein HPB47_017149, partial [Ixodes persulcatus]